MMFLTFFNLYVNDNDNLNFDFNLNDNLDGNFNDNDNLDDNLNLDVDLTLTCKPGGEVCGA